MNRSLLKVGLGVLALASFGVAASMVGCSDGGSTSDAGPDVAQQDNYVPPQDSGGMDGGGDADAAAPLAKLILVHASPELGPIRVCFAVNGTPTPLPALPHELSPAQQMAMLPFPGIYPGTGGAFPSTGTDVTPLKITPYVMNASSIKTHIKGEMPSEKVCSDMLDPDAGLNLTEGTDYWKLADIPANTFQHGKTYILILEGCTKNAGALAQRCGATWNANTGNLEAKIFQVDNVATMGKTGAQYIQASAIVDGPFAPKGVIGSMATQGGAPDGGLLLEIINTTPATYSNVQPAMKATALTPPDVAKSAVVSTFVQGDGGLGPSFALPVSIIEQLTTGYPPDGGTMYVAGQNFTFVLVGDPTRNPDGTNFVPNPDGGFPQVSVNRGYAMHLLGFPNDPVIPKLQ
jgi:hypothetical protein